MTIDAAALPAEAPARRKSRTTPTQRTLAGLKREGYLCAIVERWNPHVGIRQDLFGWIDILAVRPSDGMLIGIQTTTTDNAAARVKKIREWPHLALWLRRNQAQVWSWAKRSGGKKGGRQLWTLKIENVDVVTEDALATQPAPPAHD